MLNDVTTRIGAFTALPAAVLFLTAAAGYVAAAGLKNRRLTRLTKPFAVPLLALSYLLACRSPNVWILLGLGCGAAGDVFLIWPERKGFFAAGLAAFLLGHLAYLAAFLGPVVRGGGVPVWLFATGLPYAAAGVFLYRVLRPGLGSLKVPVAVYTGAIVLLGLASVLRVTAGLGLAFWLPVIGVVCFLISDAVLAFQQFRGPVRSGPLVVAAMYVSAQALIVLGFLLAGGWRGS